MQNLIYRPGAYARIIEEGKILLISKQKGFLKGLLDLPGGGVEPGETVEEALRRELREECALVFEDARAWANTLFRYDQTSYLGMIYGVRGWKLLDEPAEEHFDWYAIEDLHREQLTPFAKKAVENEQLKSVALVDLAAQDPQPRK